MMIQARGREKSCILVLKSLFEVVLVLGDSKPSKSIVKRKTVRFTSEKPSLFEYESFHEGDHVETAQGTSVSQQRSSHLSEELTMLSTVHGRAR